MENKPAEEMLARPQSIDISEPQSDRGGSAEAERGRPGTGMPVLGALFEGPVTEEELMLKIEESGVGGNLAPTVLQHRLQVLQKNGLVTIEESDGQRRFQLTDAGRRTLEGGFVGSPQSQGVRGEDVGALRGSLVELRSAVLQVSERGSEEQKDLANEILNLARMRIEKIMNGPA